jgi:hypothetical protein
MAAPSMNGLAEKYARNQVGSIFIYTHEAHPGEFYPHLTSMSQKFHHARQLRDVLKVTRPILVDSLLGDCHRTYGSMPNMTWIFTRTLTPVYKSDWTDVHSLEAAISYLLEISDRRKAGERLTPFRVEKLDYRVNDPEAFQLGLERNGPKAVIEFKRAFD